MRKEEDGLGEGEDGQGGGGETKAGNRTRTGRGVSVTADWTDIDPSLAPCLQETESHRGKHEDSQKPRL